MNKSLPVEIYPFEYPIKQILPIVKCIWQVDQEFASIMGPDDHFAKVEISRVPAEGRPKSAVGKSFLQGAHRFLVGKQPPYPAENKTRPRLVGNRLHHADLSAENSGNFKRLEQADDLSLFVNVHVFGGRVFGEPRHGHDITGKDDNKTGPGRRFELFNGDHKIFGSAEQFWI